MSSTEEQLALSDLKVDRDNLYREETLTDLKAATLQILWPIKGDGSADDSRPPLFMGQTQLMSQQGPLPVQCRIDAADLGEAIEKFPEAIRAAIDRLVEQAREMQREQASRIITPADIPGGKIHLR